MKNIIAGVDEVGRGAIAGPVIAAAVILKKDIEGLKDSKKISEKKRIELSNKIKKYSYFAIGSASNNEIDKFDKIIILKIHPKLPIKIVPNIICLKLLLLETLMINVPIIGASASHHAQ